jgi:DNA-binding LacI/PurR family transcriptional regulator
MRVEEPLATTTRTPKHREISEALRQQIAAGKYKDGKRLPSEMELARRFGVSRPTVARALRDLHDSSLINRRVGSGTYLRTPSGEQSARSETVIGLLVPGLGNTEILDPICNEITRFGQSNGIDVQWGDSSHPVMSAEHAEVLCLQYIEQRVTGVFFAPLETVPDREAVNLRITNTLRDAGVAVVLLDRDVPEFPGRSQFDLVGIDNFNAGMILTQHLIALGRTRFLFLARPSFPSTTDLRLAGCREATSRAQLPSPQAHFGEPTDVDFVRSILGPKAPEVVICSNDRTAALLIQTLSNLGMRLPKDIGVVGFDDVRYATLLAVPLTTIRQPCRDIGQAAVRVMQERIDNPSLPPRQVLLPAELIIRQSCGGEGTAL